MKFDYAIGNPPYQIETAIKETNNGEKTSKRIFGDFQLETEKIANKTCLIYPALGWILGESKGLKKFGYNQINDPHLQALRVYKDAKEVFPGSGIDDGVSIVLKDMKNESDKFDYGYIVNNQETKAKVAHPGNMPFIIEPNAINIITKVINFISVNNFDYLSKSILPQKLFAIESNFVEENPDKVTLYKNQKLEKNEIKLYANDKAGKAGRTTCYIIDRKYIPTRQEYIDKYKVVVSSANPIGNNRNRQLCIIGPAEAFGRSRLCIKAFDTEYEAKIFEKYLKSNIIRFCLCMTGGALTTLGSFTPDLLNYNTSNLFNLNNDFDAQLKKIININKDEYEFICNYIKIHTIPDDKLDKDENK